MRYLKMLYSVLLIMLLSLNIGCENNVNDTESIKAPKNNSLIVKGSWKIDDIKILGDSIENKDEILSLKGTLISLSENELIIFNKLYKNPNYKLKVVNNDYILSYEFELKVSDLINESNKIDILSIISSNKILGEFIILDNENGYLLYSGILLKVIKVNSLPINIDDNKNVVEAEVESEDYNSEIGVMLGLKSKRSLNSNGEYNLPEYRTLWISLKDDELQPVVEKENIIFPRINGIWEINNYKETIGEVGYEYFTLKYLDKDYVYESNLDIKNYGIGIYRDINFVSNDYISMEVYYGTNFRNKFQYYQTIPIDNINSIYGLRIGDIYNNEVEEIYNEKYIEILNENDYIYKEFIEYIDNTNFTLKRIGGRWRIVGKVLINNYNDIEEDFTIPISQNKKILNYDTLLISWKDLKNKFPFIEDAYTSPNGRIAIIIFNNKLLIYEMKEMEIVGEPLAEINLKEDEEVIMAEWASGSYVDLWSKTFKDGKILNKEEE